MASIISTNGRVAVQFKTSAGRKTISFGKLSAKQAAIVAERVGCLVSAKVSGTAVDRVTAAWLSGLPAETRAKLANTGLIDADPTAMTLAVWLETYIASRVEIADATRIVLGHTRRCLLECFDSSKPLTSFTPGDADDFRVFLAKQGLADATIRRRCGIARQLFGAAVRRRLIENNPFSDVRITVRGNLSRRFIVTPDMAAAVLDACPDVEWRVLFALARYGGLRIPSEALALAWDDCDWDKGRLRVSSPKTAHHGDAHAERFIPLFPELRRELADLFDGATPGTTWIINRYRSPACNLRTQFTRIIRRAGLAPWPKLWVNLRATRATELAARFPGHVAAAWLGHSPAVAAEHYLSVRDSDFAAAIGDSATHGEGSSAAKALHHNPLISANTQLPVSKIRGLDANNGHCRGLEGSALGDAGLEPATSRV